MQIAATELAIFTLTLAFKRLINRRRCRHANEVLPLAEKFAGRNSDHQKPLAKAHNGARLDLGFRAKIQQVQRAQLGLDFLLTIVKGFCQIGGGFGLCLLVAFDGLRAIQTRCRLNPLIGLV